MPSPHNAPAISLVTWQWTHWEPCKVDVISDGFNFERENVPVNWPDNTCFHGERTLEEGGILGWTVKILIQTNYFIIVIRLNQASSCGKLCAFNTTNKVIAIVVICDVRRVVACLCETLNLRISSIFLTNCSIASIQIWGIQSTFARLLFNLWVPGRKKKWIVHLLLYSFVIVSNPDSG